MKIKKKPIPWGAQTLQAPVKQKRVLSIPQALSSETSLTDRFELFCPTTDNDPSFENDHHRLGFAIMTEKPLYQGGEKVEICVYFYDKFSKRPLKPNEQKVQLEKINLEITDEYGLLIQNLKPHLDRGVGVITASYILKRDCEGGLYRAELRYYDTVVDRTKFYAMKITQKRNSIALDLNKDQMSAREEMKGKITLKMFTRMEDFFRTGGLGEQLGYKVIIFDQDFNEIDSFSKKLSHGKGFFNYTLPDSVNEMSSLFVVVELEFDQEKLETTREIIINKLNNMHVKFVAGGGKFVLDCENTVYFASYSTRDMRDIMTFKNAILIEKTNSKESIITSKINSNDDGRGQLDFTIKRDAEYYLQVQDAEVTRNFMIIDETDTMEYPRKKFTNVLMKIKERVYGWTEAVNIHIKNNKDSQFDKFRIVLVDKLRVLHEAIVSFPEGFNKGNMKMDLRSIPSLLNGGVANVQLYDFYDTTEPLQECLIFIQPSKKLNLELKFDKSKYSPGDTVNFEVDLGDREGLVGVVVSDETPFLELERRDLPTSLATKVFLEKELFFADYDFNDSVKYIDWLFENNEFISQQLLEAGGVSPNYGLVGYKENKRKQLSILLGLQDWRLFFLNEKSIRAFIKKTGWEITKDSLNHLLGLSTTGMSNIFFPPPKYLQMVCNHDGVRHGVFCSKRNYTTQNIN